MNSTPEDLAKALRRSLKQNERPKRARTGIFCLDHRWRWGWDAAYPGGVDLPDAVGAGTRP